MALLPLLASGTSGLASLYARRKSAQQSAAPKQTTVPMSVGTPGSYTPNQSSVNQSTGQPKNMSVGQPKPPPLTNYVPMSVGQPGSYQQNQSYAPKPTAPSQAQVAAAQRPPAEPITSLPSSPSPRGVDSSYTSADSSVQAKIRAMQEQTLAQSSQAKAPSQSAGVAAPVRPQTNPVQTPQPIPAQSRERVEDTPAFQRLMQARQQYLQSLQASPEEMALADQLEQFRGAAREGILAQEGQGRLVPLDLVRGKQAKLGEQAAIQEQTLLGRLNAAQQARQLAAQAAQTSLGFEQFDYEKALQQQQLEQQASQPFEFDGKLVRLNTQTGQLETLAEATPRAAEGFTLSQGQARYDAAGNLIASSQMDPLEQQKKILELQKLQQDIENYGQLSPIDQLKYQQLYNEVYGGGSGGSIGGSGGLKDVNKTDQAKKLQGISSLNKAIDQYKALIQEHGSASWVTPGARQKLDAAKTFVLTAIKEAEALGALQAPDIELIQGMLPSVTHEGLFSPLAGLFKPGESSRAIATLDQVKQQYASRAQGYVDELISLGASPTDPYIQQLSGASGARLPINTQALSVLTGRQRADGSIVSDTEAAQMAQEVSQLERMGYSQDQILQIINSSLGFTNALSTAKKGSMQELGTLSKKYESGGNPGAIGYDRTGGYSYGTYQLAHNNAKKFVDQSPYAKEFSGLTFNSQAWRNKWQQIAKRDPDGFARAQHAYIEKTHYAPQVQKIAQAGINLSKFSDVLKDVIWSTAVQHGGATNLVVNVLKNAGNLSESEIIKRIYNARWNGGKNFAGSTKSVAQAVYNRFFGKNGELNTALSRLQNIG